MGVLADILPKQKRGSVVLATRVSERLREDFPKRQ